MYHPDSMVHIFCGYVIWHCLIWVYFDGPKASKLIVMAIVGFVIKELIE